MTKPIDLVGGARQGGRTRAMVEQLNSLLEKKAVAYVPARNIPHARRLRQILEDTGLFKIQFNAKRPVVRASPLPEFIPRELYFLVSKL